MPLPSVEALLFAGGVLFGSRALEVHNNYPDYNIAILESTFIALFQGVIPAEKIGIRNYFKVIPKIGTNYLVQTVLADNKEVDLLVMSEQSSIDIVRESIEHIKSCSTAVLRDKRTRIQLYEEQLCKNGFKLQLRYRIANFVIKHF